MARLSYQSPPPVEGILFDIGDSISRDELKRLVDEAPPGAVLRFRQAAASEYHDFELHIER
ncbi:hypothetical protein [Parafrankia sp. EUN1f]|uniref:hypothetical protein n=1 Tax=Parafrankia sp. EUN1f TaxID=102897 RepID=UPI0001C459A8|nr:hypothetical protein [Parafrankia sp. EUN1f]EFC86495.1 hypothetical protein FrEUN1fDRAFT_0390 [Parafrankia sp. EUN1f]